MKKFLIAGNWKMNKTTAEAREFAIALKSMNLENAQEVAILAPYTQLSALSDELDGSGIRFGAQNVHYEASGAYTGEISVPMLKEIGVDFCIVGHSERREYFKETDAEINAKVKALIEAGITPILCVGESLQTREMQAHQTFVASQLIMDLEGITFDALKKVVIAYEPIWAIGTGKTATAEQAEEMCAFIKGVMGGAFSDDVANSIQVLYGGSMKPSNAEEILAKPSVDGGLIGGASLKVDDFVALANAASKLSK